MLERDASTFCRYPVGGLWRGTPAYDVGGNDDGFMWAKPEWCRKLWGCEGPADMMVQLPCVMLEGSPGISAGLWAVVFRLARRRPFPLFTTCP